METKICGKCNIEKPVSEYHKHKTGKGGLRSSCKECRREEGRQYAQLPSSKESRRLSSARWRKNNPERVKELRKRIRDNNKEKYKEISRKKYWSNPEAARSANAKWRKRNPEKLKEYSVKRIAELPDNYIIGLMKRWADDLTEPPAETIETRRLTLLIKRELNQTK